MTALGLKTVLDNDGLKSNNTIKQESKDNPKSSNVDISANLFTDISMCVNMYTESVKNKNPHMFKKCVIPELFQSLQNTMQHEGFNPHMLDYFFYQHIKKVIRAIYDLSNDDLIDIEKFQYIKVVKVQMLKSWLDENLPEILDMPVNVLSLEKDYKDVAIAEGSFFYNNELKIVHILFVYNHNVNRWQLARINKETTSSLKFSFENNLLLFYSCNCRSVLEKNVLDDLDENNTFKNYLIDGILSCDNEHTNLIAISISIDKLEVVSKKVRLEMNMVAKALQQKSCVWFIRYLDGIPVQMYMAHDEKSKFVGGYDFNTKQLIKENVVGGIWSILD